MNGGRVLSVLVCLGAVPVCAAQQGFAGADAGLRQALERASDSLEFDGVEVRLSHPDGSVRFQLTGYGHGERLRTPALATLSGTGNRREYQRGDFTEWCVNGAAGSEQGFMLAKRPGAEGGRRRRGVGRRDPLRGPDGSRCARSRAALAGGGPRERSWSGGGTDVDAAGGVDGV